MTSLWLVANSASGTTDAGRIDEARGEILRLGFDLARIIDLSAQPLPELAPGGENAPALIASLGGDGTANAVIDRYGGTADATLLILPGGTMNLLARRLHGEADMATVLARAAHAPAIATLPMIEGPDFHSLAGVIAGPATHWGTVRERLREGDLATLIDSVPAALEQTFEGHRIRLEGQQEGYAALFVEPVERGLRVHVVRADSLVDLAAHGWAWLNRDFLGGPTEELMQQDEVVLAQDGGHIALLADGERYTPPSPLRLRWARCPARFLATRES